MKEKFLVITLLLVMALIISPACQKAPPEFEVASLEMVPPEVMAGETVTISAQVKNSGGQKQAASVIQWYELLFRDKTRGLEAYHLCFSISLEHCGYSFGRADRSFVCPDEQGQICQFRCFLERQSFFDPLVILEVPVS